LFLATNEWIDLFHPLITFLLSATLIFTEILTLDFLSVHFQNELPNLQATGFECGTILLKGYNNTDVHTTEIEDF
jgi:hypothetical protein